MVKPPQTQTMVTVSTYNREKPAQALCVVRQAPVPELLPGHVLVHVRWRPINPSDVLRPASFLPDFRSYFCGPLLLGALLCTQITSCHPAPA